MTKIFAGENFIKKGLKTFSCLFIEQHQQQQHQKQQQEQSQLQRHKKQEDHLHQLQQLGQQQKLPQLQQLQLQQLQLQQQQRQKQQQLRQLHQQQQQQGGQQQNQLNLNKGEMKIGGQRSAKHRGSFCSSQPAAPKFKVWIFQTFSKVAAKSMNDEGRSCLFCVRQGTASDRTNLLSQHCKQKL